MKSPLRIKAIDIETVSQGKVANDYTDSQPVKYGNIKDPAKIDAAIKEKREELRNSHGLHWWTGKIVSIALVDVYHAEPTEVFYGHNEVEILKSFTRSLSGKPMKLVGKQSADFDFPFIIGRLMANKITVPSLMKDRFNLLDVNTLFGYSSASAQRGKLQDYSHGLGFKSKLMHGGAVQSLYNQIIDCDMKGDTEGSKKLWKQLTEYNIDDTVKVADMVKLYYGEGDERDGI